MLRVDLSTDLASLTQSELFQLNQNLLEEAAQKRPLMSEIQPLSVLREEYDGAPGFVSKIDWLRARGWLGLRCALPERFRATTDVLSRRTLGDGDCFYRYVYALPGVGEPPLINRSTRL